MALDLRGIFAYWESIGVFDVVLPFFLVFAIAYSILSTAKVLGEANKNITALVSAIIGVLFVQNSYLVGILQSFIPNVAMFIIVILMVFLVAGTFTGQRGTPALEGSFAFVAIAALAFVVWALLVQPPTTSWLPTYYLDDQTLATLVLVGIFVLVIWFVTKPKEGNGLKTFGKYVKDILKGGTGGG